MAKFYVQSGTLRKMVQAESSRKAAIWAVHEAMRQVLPMDDCPGESAETKSQQVGGKGVAVLSAGVKVSQHGFDRGDATTLGTLELVSEWNQMIETLDRLERMLQRAA
jgi:hypothetical protein